MVGPCPKGYWTRAVGAAPFRHLVPGQRYRVVRAFVDFDGCTHPVDETWQYTGSNYSAYHEGLSLFVSLDGESEWHIRLSDRPEDQGSIIAALEAYVVLTKF